MAIPQMLTDIARLLMQLLPAMALLSLLLAGISLRLEGGSTFLIGGGFTKWMLWAIILITMPQLLLWFGFFGLPVPATAGNISTGWLVGIRTDVATFINSFVIGRLTLALAAFFIIRAVLDASHGNSPLASVLTAMFLLAIPSTANLITTLQTATRFSPLDAIDGLWNYLAGRIMPIAAGLAVIGAIFNFATHRPAMRLIACAIGFLTVSALWRLVLQMM
jgi:hypothetical protein